MSRGICGKCHFPNPSWWLSMEKEHACECGTRFIKGPLTLHRVFKKVKKFSVGERQRGVWTADERLGRPKVYLTCPNCGRIHEVDLKGVHRGGFVGGWVPATCICCTCDYHFWPYLDGWGEK